MAGAARRPSASSRTSPHTSTMNADNSDVNTETIVSRLSPARRAVYEAFLQHGAMTDDDLVIKTGIKKATSSPRRSDLVKMGLIEAVGKGKTPTGGRATRWDLVPPERIAAARAQASQKGPRRRPIQKYPLEQRLEIVRQLLDMDDLNEAIRDLHGRAWSRVRGRAQDRRGDRERERRENDARLREAEQRGSPVAEYFKLRRILMTSAERVHAVTRLVSEELERRFSGEQKIPVNAWADVADLLNDLARSCDEANAQIREVMGDTLGDDVIEGSVIVIEESLELPEGDDEADVA